MNNYMPLSIQGVPVTISVPVPVKSSVKRTWKERLLTLPFTPLTKFKQVEVLTDVLEDGQIIKSVRGLVMNAKTFNDCEKALFNKVKLENNQ